MMTRHSGKPGGAVDWTPANVVTVVRIALIPVFLILLLVPWAAALWSPAMAANAQAFVAMGVFALISLTDSLDGYLARSRNEITVFGKFMDPIADKVLVISALVALVELGALPSWIPIVIIARELLVSGLRMLVASAGVVVAANWIGKAKTFTTMVAICMFIIDGAPALSGVQPWFHIASWTLMLMAVVLTVVSMADYFAHSWALLSDGGSKRRSAGVAHESPHRQTPAAPVCDASLIEGHHTGAQDVVEAARIRGMTLGTAESCTGGLVAAALTSVPGSSKAVVGGIVAYEASVKERLLSVDHVDIAEHGVVSIETASAMARGARTALPCDIAVSTTGIAGPGGAEPDKPVGTVCVAVATPTRTIARRISLSGTRDEIRAQAVENALAMIAEALETE